MFHAPVIIFILFTRMYLVRLQAVSSPPETDNQDGEELWRWRLCILHKTRREHDWWLCK